MAILLWQFVNGNEQIAMVALVSKCARIKAPARFQIASNNLFQLNFAIWQTGAYRLSNFIKFESARFAAERANKLRLRIHGDRLLTQPVEHL